MIACLVEAILLVAVILAVVWFVILLFADSDVALTLKAKFGKQPEALNGQVVWLTGASSGIGEYYAYCLAESGCKLVLSARRKDELERVKKACLASEKSKLKDEDILVLPFDVKDFECHKTKVEEVLSYFSRIDILINNAGKGQRAKWVDVELDVDREMFDINVLGPVSLTQAVLPHMIERKQGHIVVVSSLAGKLGAPVSRSYTGTKHAVQGYFDCLRTEVADDNIDVTIICPGPVYSNLFIEAATAKVGETVGKPLDLKEKRMTGERHAYLSCVAIANKVYEAWTSIHPVLLYVYIHQFVPDLMKWHLARMGLKKIMALRDGK